MENIVTKGPKDAKILNKDDSVTNKDGNSQQAKTKEGIDQEKHQNDTTAPANDNPDFYDKTGTNSNKGQVSAVGNF